MPTEEGQVNFYAQSTILNQGFIGRSSAFVGNWDSYDNPKNTHHRSHNFFLGN